MKPDYLCSNDDCERVREGLTPFCSSCNHANRKAERQAQKDAAKVKKPIKKVADKRAKELREYSKLRREYLDCHPACEVRECHNRSKEIHHMQTRTNDNLLNTDLFLAVCPSCHHRITVDSAWAIREGYSLPRNTKK